MRELDARIITDSVKELCIKANYILPDDIRKSLCEASECEPFPVAKNTLDILIDNYQIAENDNIPICQDTGLACVFIEIGQDLHINGNLEDAK